MSTEFCSFVTLLDSHGRIKKKKINVAVQPHILFVLLYAFFFFKVWHLLTKQLNHRWRLGVLVAGSG